VRKAYFLSTWRRHCAALDQTPKHDVKSWYCCCRTSNRLRKCSLMLTKRRSRLYLKRVVAIRTLQLILCFQCNDLIRFGFNSPTFSNNLAAAWSSQNEIAVEWKDSYPSWFRHGANCFNVDIYIHDSDSFSTGFAWFCFFFAETFWSFVPWWY